MEQGTATGWGDLLPVPRPAEASAQDGGPGTLGAGAPATAATAGSPAFGDPGRALAAALAAQSAASHGQERVAGLRVPAGLPLLAVQVVLSLRLVRAAQTPRSWCWPIPGCGLASSSLLAADKLIAAAPAGRMRAFTCGACVIALAFPVTLRASQSRVFATSWPGAG
jgi:hypothetical protein